ncbi:SDR family oxidoreductase [Pseudomonas nunensis]|uniref:SDR family oxidoreductase n=1 Tax=Pseudomonas nunensis TaxID=2961896 RepID=A0ABY5ETY5_9PSED|nr:SDR family oxidoreductase [Pseudomonas nunensis]KPN91360.1 quinone oxidoreductase [Pseudomonas nunensis]MCL5229974.1 SDR family oxidoreductase [Pseudomonas nunensis]UTO17635.1 SDR family oxidoreductase [Pseudomonas nunensis]
MIAVTGATGQLGRLVIDSLLKTVNPHEIVALVRDPLKAQDLGAKGVNVRQADYNQPETLLGALVGVQRLLLISSSEVGQRTAQHRAVIEAAKSSGVQLLAYTSMLHADKSTLGLAVEHRDTERALVESGLNYVLLRNGWYSENYTASVSPAVEHGAILGCAQEGRISSAARKDYADAAAVVLTSEGQAGKVYELAGDESYSLSELATEVAKQSGKTVVYNDLPQEQYKAVLIGLGLPAEFAGLLADSDAAAAKGDLFDDSRQLSELLGRPTTLIAQSVSAALKY